MISTGSIIGVSIAAERETAVIAVIEVIVSVCGRSFPYGAMRRNVGNSHTVGGCFVRAVVRDVWGSWGLRV